MPRPRVIADEAILGCALDIARRRGPAAVTLAAVGEACGLSGSTLVQRFSTKATLMHAALVHAWDVLDRQTLDAAARAPLAPEGAIRFLADLSRGYGNLDNYADGLLLLREDLRHPELRQRGIQWGEKLRQVVERRLEGECERPDEMAALIVSHWQGVLLWWGFDPQEAVEARVTRELHRLFQAVGLSSGEALGVEKA